jgi:hypothetical protein
LAVGWLLEALELSSNMWISLSLDCALDILGSIITIVLFLFFWESTQPAEVEGDALLPIVGPEEEAFPA